MELNAISKLLLMVTLIQLYQASPLQESHNKLESLHKVIPKSYSLNIQIHPEEERFTGEVIINVAAVETVNTIPLNAHKNLTIQNTEVFQNNFGSEASKQENVKIKKTEKVDETSTFNIVLETPLHAGSEYKVKITFSGKLNTHSTEGLFKKSYLDGKTEQTKWIIASQFKPNLTSSAFPCFDDAYFKVPFDVSIQRPSKLSSLSTMPLLRSVDMGTGWTKDIYASTPPMATFSLAIFVSDLTSVIYNKPDLQIRIWPAPELLHYIKKNRSEIIYSALNRFGKIFDVKYPLSKLDYIALPSAAQTTILDNWGLIISSYIDLECDSITEKMIIASEMTNQWIGSFVTPYSTDDEISVSALSGFFSFMQKYLDEEAQGVSDTWAVTSLYSDYYEFGKPVSSESADIRRMSSTSKAELVYRMLMYTLTESTFLSALKNLIKNKQFKTFQMDDFWETLTKQAHYDGTLSNDLSVKDIASTWINNYRLPYLTVTRNYDANSVMLTQRVFVRERSYITVKNDILWKIPIVLVKQDKLDFTNTKPIYWMKKKDFNVKNVANSDQFIIINPGEIGPFMVNYDKTNWNMLANFLQSSERTKIPVRTRAKLVHDALNLAYAGNLDFGTALNVTVYLKDEVEHAAWRPFLILFDHIGRHIDGTKVLKKYQEFVTLLSKNVYDYLNAKDNNQDRQIKEFRNELRATLLRVGDENLLKEANTVYAKWMQNPAKNYKDSSRYFCTIFRYGTDEQWEFGLKTLKNLEDKPEIERYYLFKTLVGCTEDSWKIKKFLNVTLFEQNGAFTDGDFKYAVFMLTGGADGYMATFDYLRENWSALKTRLEHKPEIWHQLIYTATSLYKTQDGLNKVTEFYNEHRGQFGTAEKTIQNSLKKIKQEVQWTNENMNTLENWLDNFILKNTPQD